MPWYSRRRPAIPVQLRPSYENLEQLAERYRSFAGATSAVVMKEWLLEMAEQFEKEAALLRVEHLRERRRSGSRRARRKFMADDEGAVGADDRNRIDLNEDSEVSFWSESFGVSERELRIAVEKVGPSVDAVRDYLNKD